MSDGFGFVIRFKKSADNGGTGNPTSCKKIKVVSSNTADCNNRNFYSLTDRSQSFDRKLCDVGFSGASEDCTVLITGKEDVVSDGKQTQILTGGDSRIRRITGGGCMLSALCTLFLCTDTSAFDAVRAAGALWRETALEAGRRTDAEKSGIGSFHIHLFDVLEEKLMYTSKHKF